MDEAQIAEKLKTLESKGLKKPAVYSDFRKLLEDKSIDAVSLATPNHWHTLQTIWACQAGKDVYVEKPLSHNVFESQQIVAAARKYNRMVQQGSQSRSSPALREAVQRLEEGEFGEVYMSRGLCYKWRDSIGKYPDGFMAPGEKFAYTVGSTSYEPTYDAAYMSKVNYDLWLGPAPNRPFNRNRFHYNWHWFWDTGNGDLGNQGIHEVDIARWGLGVTHPTKVSAIGGKFMFDDAQETPNTITSSFEFDVAGKKKMMTFEVRHWISPHEAGINGEKPGNTIGNQFYGSKGYLVIDNYNKYYSFLGRDQKPGPDGDQGRHALRQLHRRRAQPQAPGSDRRGRRRCALLQPDAPGEHQLPARPDAALGREDADVRRRRRSEQDADARVPGAVRGAEERLRTHFRTNSHAGPNAMRLVGPDAQLCKLHPGAPAR